MLASSASPCLTTPMVSSVYFFLVRLLSNPARSLDTFPLVKLGPEFKDVSEYTKRIRSLPDIKDLDHLTVSGDVCFGRNVILKV